MTRRSVTRFSRRARAQSVNALKGGSVDGADRTTVRGHVDAGLDPGASARVAPEVALGERHVSVPGVGRLQVGRHRSAVAPDPVVGANLAPPGVGGGVRAVEPERRGAVGRGRLHPVRERVAPPQLEGRFQRVGRPEEGVPLRGAGGGRGEVHGRPVEPEAELPVELVDEAATREEGVGSASGDTSSQVDRARDPRGGVAQAADEVVVEIGERDLAHVDPPLPAAVPDAVGAAGARRPLAAAHLGGRQFVVVVGAGRAPARARDDRLGQEDLGVLRDVDPAPRVVADSRPLDEGVPELRPGDDGDLGGAPRQAPALPDDLRLVGAGGAGDGGDGGSEEGGDHEHRTVLEHGRTNCSKQLTDSLRADSPPGGLRAALN